MHDTMLVEFAELILQNLDSNTRTFNLFHCVVYIAQYCLFLCIFYKHYVVLPRTEVMLPFEGGCMTLVLSEVMFTLYII